MQPRNVYLDNNATTPLHPEVKNTLIEAMENYGNPSSLHQFGRYSRNKVEGARERISSFIGADPDEIIFVGSGSEANNTVLSSLTCQPVGHCEIGCQNTSVLTTNIEHPCILESAKCLRDRGMAVGFLDVDGEGKVDLEQYKQMINPQTGLVSVMMANNETGTIQDIKLLSKIAHENGVLFHTDSVQAVGKIPVNVRELDVDFLSLSAHKIYGPKGIGVLYIKKGVSFCPLIRGGHQEKGRRAGTENTIGIIGLGKAIEMREIEMASEAIHLLELKNQLKAGLSARIPDILFVGDQEDCLPGTLNVSFSGAEGEAILLYLDLEGIAVSTGSACASGSLDPSHVLLAMGLEAENAHGSIRLSLGRDTTKEDIEYVVEKLESTIGRIRDMSTVYHRSN
ncbi:MAG: aminotransferase class V-fold PLP-dependent enzyme [Deltaproteobacteria bacterium]|nr:aminotransferase class V-fold PLP-dependent enzyme [Deltaproteobacteria bacterium]MBT4089471.1 aminotransferase class V-fold PLP-dependent enzyme [Deltaproteobacteria bacterium]MBT4267337.1 aminotransferase class V-fold PLP-dependent enzyme [Deltaproteobacteria bacterium]MBT4643177.1 aminotransferase class V-fold PLP-dependent enzyme [Deltaproteobacteria bacterium]MBT6500193.1 aminotransferase class V-fold PLP-dependent enzyme [Deltaproteobacteria bacterium]